ncbi:thioesterase superfamily protein [Colletotrichum falcatum]|nr:thioesterase superfamily protein [Colletotrichum falcatum]
MVEPSKSQMAHFQAIPWVARELAEPGLVIQEPASRVLDPDTRAFEFWGSTLHTPTTVPFFVGAYRLPPEPDAGDDTADGPQPQRCYIKRARFFLTLGRGVSTIDENLCHGGVVASILDECAGATCWANKANGFLEFLPQVTRSLSVSYLKPVPTMATVAVTASLATADGIELAVDLVLTDEAGTALAKGEAVFTSIRRTKKKGGGEKL